MCGFLRSTDTYREQLVQLSLGHQLPLQQSSPASTTPASFLHRLVGRDQTFKQVDRTLVPGTRRIAVFLADTSLIVTLLLLAMQLIMPARLSN